MSAGALSARRGLPRSGLGPLGAGGLALGGAALAAAAAVILGPVALALPVGALAVALLLRYPLALLVAFLHIGLLKNEAAFQALPVDATGVLGGLLALVCAYRALARRASSPPAMFVAPTLVIAVLLGLSLLWSPVPDYGAEKAGKFVTLTLLGAVAPFCLIESRRDLVDLLKLFAAGAAVMSVLVATLGSTAEEGRLEFSGAANTIFTSRFLLTGGLILLVAPVLRVFPRHRLILPLVGLGLIAVAASIGSRGPVVGLVLALACVVAVVVLREPRRILPVLLVVTAGVAVFPFITLPETSAERLQGLAKNPVGALNEDLRSRLYAKAVELSRDHPLRGIGAGGFFLYSYVLTNREERYPHNVFLETSAELGLAPALLLAAAIATMLAAACRRAWAAQESLDRNLVYVVIGVFLMNLFAAQFSGDFNDNKTFWAAFGLLSLIAVRGVPAPRDASPAPRVA